MGLSHKILAHHILCKSHLLQIRCKSLLFFLYFFLEICYKIVNSLKLKIKITILNIFNIIHDVVIILCLSNEIETISYVLKFSI